jgi:hypothetical protein
LRAFLIALPLCVPAVFWGADQGMDVILSLMVPPVVCLMLVMLLNAPVRRFWPRRALSAGELVLVYAFIQTAVAVAAEWGAIITPHIFSFGLYGNETNQFGTLLVPYLPKWLFITSPEGFEDFKRGGWPASYFFKRMPLWIGPVLGWTALVTLVGVAMLCVNALMREQWTERERLSFPIIQLPLSMATGGRDGRFWRDRLMWGAAFTVFAIDIWNGFNLFYPSLPRLNVRFLGDLTAYFPDPPWNATGWTPIGLFPFIVALGTFVPTDLLFSVIFFFFIRKAQQIVAVMMGHEGGIFAGAGLVPAPPYLSEQS